MKLILYHRLFRQNEKGQALVIMVGAFIGLLILVGLVTDGALLYVNNAHLRQAVDAGAVAAAGQYRKGRDIEDLHAAAVEVVKLQLPSGLRNVETYWWPVTGAGPKILNYAGEPYTPTLYQPYTTTLETDPPRKLVRVKACLDVDLVFLPIAGAGFEQVTLCAQAEAEAALLNLVLLLDTSESMAYGVDRDQDGDVDEDPNACPWNPVYYPRAAGPDQEMFDSYPECLRACSDEGWCSPFEGVRDAAMDFVNMMRDGVDSVAVYHFDKTPVLTQSVDSSFYGEVIIPVSEGHIVPLTSTLSKVTEAIQDNGKLHVYIRPERPDESGLLVSGFKWKNTNIGGGLREATDELVNNGKADAIWVIVLLTDGAANATDKAADENGWWTCPEATRPGCRDETLPVTRHCPSVNACSDPSMCLDPDDPNTCWYTDWGEVITETKDYDADDYARDMADMAATYETVLFTIGFGKKVADVGDDAGERLLRYIADVGDDGDRSTAPCGSDSYWDFDHVQPLPGRGESCGNYYYAPDKDELEDVFEAIAARVFLRITE